MIDRKSGQINISPEVALKPHDSFKNIQGLELGEAQLVRHHKNGYSWITIKNLKVEKRYFILDLCFENKRLVEISLILNDRKFSLDPGWESLNELKEKAKVVKFRNWINHELGRVGKFGWGTVWTGYDDKSAASSIVISYH